MNHRPFQPEKIAGLWIDHKQAVLVELSADSPAATTVFESGIRFRPRKDVPAEPRTKEQVQHRRNNQLHQFYYQLILRLRDFDHLYLIGPGEAKNEFKSAFEKEAMHFPCKIVAVEPVDRLTKNQLIQQVKKYFRSLSYEDKVRTHTAV